MGAPRKQKPVAVNLDALTGDLAALRMIAGDEMMEQACVLLQKRLGLTGPKLMALLMRRLSPDLLPSVPEECDVRGVTAKPLKRLKDGKVLPRVMQGRIA